MLDKIKRWLAIENKKPSNSVLFWNAMYYVTLGISALFSLDLFWLLYGISSFLAIGILFDNDESLKINYWVMTSMPILFLGFVGGIAFIIIYPFYKLVTWINKLLNGKTCLRHDYKRITETPPMRDSDNTICSFEVTYECRKCNKEKKGWSDMYLGMEIIIDEDEKD